MAFHTCFPSCWLPEVHVAVLCTKAVRQISMNAYMLLCPCLPKERQWNNVLQSRPAVYVLQLISKAMGCQLNGLQQSMLRAVCWRPHCALVLQIILGLLNKTALKVVHHASSEHQELAMAETNPKELASRPPQRRCLCMVMQDVCNQHNVACMPHKYKRGTNPPPLLCLLSLPLHVRLPLRTSARHSMCRTT